MGYRILVGLPGRIGHFAAYRAAQMGSDGRHQCVVVNADAIDGNFNALWCAGLNAFESGEYTHHAQIHADVIPVDGWADVMIEEMERKQATFISAAIAVKDSRRLLSCGIAHEMTWRPFRRVTIRELANLPPTFDAADYGYPGKPLLHNNGLMIADLRDPRWREEDETGNLVAWFDFLKRVERNPETGRWWTKRESEDFYFSRQIHRLGIRSVITQRVPVMHMDNWTPYPNRGVTDGWEHDEDSRDLWGAAEPNVVLNG